MEDILNRFDDCDFLAYLARMEFGPGQSHKILLPTLKLFISENCSPKVIEGIDVQGTAARTLILASKAQEEEFADGVNFTIVFAVELLNHAKRLINKCGLSPHDIVKGYRVALDKSLEFLKALVEVGSEKMDVKNKEQVVQRMQATIATQRIPFMGSSTRIGLNTLSSHIAEACIKACPKDPAKFDVDNVFFTGLVAENNERCEVLRGLVFGIPFVGWEKKMEKVKVAMLDWKFDAKVENFDKIELDKVKELFKAGAKVVVSEDDVTEETLHFCDLHKIMVLIIPHKRLLSYFCRTTGANLKDLGYADSIFVREIDGIMVIVVEKEINSIYSVVTLASGSKLSQCHNAIVAGVRTYKEMCKDSRIVPGAGATEYALHKRLLKFRAKDFFPEEAGCDILPFEKFALSLKFVPETLAKNSGFNVKEILSSLSHEYEVGYSIHGIDLEKGICKDIFTLNIWDLYTTKMSALKNATDAACTLLLGFQSLLSSPMAMTTSTLRVEHPSEILAERQQSSDLNPLVHTDNHHPITHNDNTISSSNGKDDGKEPQSP